MSPRYQYIDDILREHSLFNPQLKVLIADHLTYTTLLYQHRGDLIAIDKGAKFIGNENRAEAIEKHKQFLNLAVKEAVDLAITPEYSCPLEVLDEFVAQNKFPEEGGLWMTRPEKS
jgi:hypothetical protein